MVPTEPLQATSMSLLQRATSNDQAAWEQLVHLYGPLVYRWCQRSGLGRDELDDVFQETFRSVSSHLESFKPARSVGSFRSWLRTIVRTKVADHFRKRSRQPHGQGGTAAQLYMANMADPLSEETDVEADEDNATIVSRALELIQPEFSEQNWKAFRLVALEGQSAAVVARDLHLNPQAVRQANYRIRRRLRLLLQDLVE